MNKSLLIRLYGSLLLIFSCLLIPAGCLKKDDHKWVAKTSDPESIHRTMKAITDRIVFDIFSPPVASRIYTYCSVALYEAARHQDSTLVTLSGQLTGLGALPQPQPGMEYSYELAGLRALYRTGKALVFSEDVLQAYYDKMDSAMLASGIPSAVYNRSIAFGDSVSAAVLKWASKDNYKQTRSFPKYTIAKDEYSWKPTPPAYMDAVEPHWNKIRPFTLDSAGQFKPNPPVAFSTKKGSDFYKLAQEVMDIRNNITDEQKWIASFWDCNPFMMNVNGHVMFANKKISPGGHWINITANACRTQKLTAARSAEAYVRVALSLADAFISCWDEKYRSKLIRPETYINQYMDENWVPILQTPPFPEYTSGHSTISGSAATALTDLFGDNYQFSDSTEMEFGIPARSFTSFQQAANEASVSRLYGGIHYRPALDEGLRMGRAIGAHVIARIQTRRKVLEPNSLHFDFFKE